MPSLHRLSSTHGLNGALQRGPEGLGIEPGWRSHADVQLAVGHYGHATAGASAA